LELPAHGGRPYCIASSQHLIALPRIPHNIIESHAITLRRFILKFRTDLFWIVDAIIALWELKACIPEHNFLLLPLTIEEILGLLSGQLGEPQIPIPIGKGRHNKIPPLLTPLTHIHNLIHVLRQHQHTHYGCVPLYLFLLVSDCVQKLLLIVLVLQLHVPQLGEAGHVLLLDVFELLAHLVHLLVESPVVLLDVQQLLLSAPLLLQVLLLFLLLLFELLRELLDFVEFG
jgi:hypothetical protein